MDITGVSGNEKLKSRIKSAAARRSIPHASLIVGQEGAGKFALAKFIAAALLCRKDRPPCMDCRDCRKVNSGIHPDIYVLDTQDRLIKVEEIRKLRNDTHIRPNEAERKVYIVHKAERMNINGANALLKVLEDPPAGVAFILTTQEPDMLPKTLRSRCETFAMEPPGRQHGEPQPEAGVFWELLCSRDEAALAGFAVEHEKMGREELVPFLESLKAMAAHAAARSCARAEGKEAKSAPVSIPPASLIAMANLFGQARSRCESNVRAGTLIASLAASCWELL